MTISLSQLLPHSSYLWCVKNKLVHQTLSSSVENLSHNVLEDGRIHETMNKDLTLSGGYVCTVGHNFRATPISMI